MKPLNDQLKVELIATDEFGFGGEKDTAESGIAVELPDKFNFFGFHSFAFEQSFMNEEKLTALYTYYEQLIGKRVFWKSLSERGMVLQEGDKKFAFIKLTDLIAYADKNVEAVNVHGASGGSFNVA